MLIAHFSKYLLFKSNENLIWSIIFFVSLKKKSEKIQELMNIFVNDLILIKRNKFILK
jgi:hypothetical protein